MATSHVLLVIFSAVIVVVPLVFGEEFIVGDEKGWTTKFDYAAWAKGKEFRFSSIRMGAHTVLRVDGTGFQTCVAPVGTDALTTGNDVITLATPGRKWYICGVGQHCETGNQKLVITVLPQLISPVAAPPPPQTGAPVSSPNSAVGIKASKYQIFMVALPTFLTMLLLV
ncbi:Plastocyanin-like [Macleaya cordata]|uniref:Plastocyanin-like n=1 Tax=Macleaya cordata TaxID=56857 RepID=A0A200QB97_MACCD|nr:Plastocyanin-like [Macleaya cordata]